ncbi:hypothetical protein LN42_08590 [Marinitoga sp. 1137]|uniref:radical SAM/SPASM domain-containing protein n=1 Tax=Marinitoga sp. 1137 TaxID=1545835 RepID=UPI000950433B|nr:radical SAM protein [Marinitoga sp. 1137]APT76427.1 hypothetical protein LN42_08590 [Marinitoga sp. 1137]
MKWKIYDNNDKKYALDLESVTLIELDDEAYKHFTEDAKSEEVDEDIKILKEAINKKVEESEKFYNSEIIFEPSNIILNITKACNLECIYCYAHKEKPESMKMELIKESLEYIFSNTKKKKITITYFGGEPLLEFEKIKESVALSKELGKKYNKKVVYSITTNGTIMNEEIIEFLIKEKFSMMMSMDGCESIQNFQRPFVGGKGSHEKVSENIELIMKKRKKLNVRATVTNQEIEIKKIARHFIEEKNLSGYSFAVASYPYTKEWTEEEKKKLYEEVEEIIEEKDKRFIPLNISGLWETIKKGEIKKYPCGAGLGIVSIDIDGKIYPCQRFTGEKEYELGEVGMKWEEFINNKKEFYKKVVKKIEEDCGICELRNICGGGCPYELLTKSNSRSISCDLTKIGLEKLKIGG